MACLRAVVALLKDIPRRVADTVARYGGEELACILPDTDLPGAMAVAERIRQSVMELQIPHEASGVSDRVTLSLGVQTVRRCDEGVLPETMLRMADEQLYAAKAAGRNRVLGRVWPERASD